MKKTVAIIGGGASALSAAAFIDEDQFHVSIYEKNKSLGRKFLVAGDGGFNLTHSETISSMKTRYSPQSFLDETLDQFTNTDFCAWLEKIGIPTFVGSSGRIYPEKGIKPITVLTHIMDELNRKQVAINVNHSWKNWGESNELIFDNGLKIAADYVLFSLGGSSWKVTGSDGSWLSTFEEKGIETRPFLSSNCAYRIDWSDDFLEKNAGEAIKNCSIRCGKRTQKGEVVVTEFGLEGNAIYALTPEIQQELDAHGSATIYLDFKPTVHMAELHDRLVMSTLSTTEILKRKIKLSAVQIHLLKSYLSKEEFTTIDLLAEKIKAFPLTVIAAAPLDEAISTTGGIDLGAVNASFELKTMNNTFCMGEMLDWNAPTGGYLLQACFSMGVRVARELNRRG